MTAAVCAIVLAGFTANVHGEPDGQQWAVLIAVQKYDDRSLNLRFSLHDADEMRKVLVERAGIPADHILQMTDDSPDAAKPVLKNLRRELPRFLANVGKEDRVLIFYSGHGFQREGKTYLVPADFRREEPAASGLPMSEVRSALVNCAARLKFLVLDCCHAGGARDLPPSTLPAESLAKAVEVRRVPGCVVLASCKDDERSWEWEERQSGVFTWWLCRAMEGGADENGDGQLTADEIYKYTYERVAKTAAAIFPEAQEPVRLAGEVPGVPVVLTLRPEPPETLCRRLAEHLDLEIRGRKLKKIGVLEFLRPLQRTEGLAHANLPAFCAEKVRTALAETAGSAYAVLTMDQARTAAKGVRVEEIGDPAAMHRMGTQAGGLDAVVTGTVRRRGRNLELQCDLVAIADGNSLVKPAGLFPLSEDLLGDQGASLNNAGRPSGSPYSPAVVQRVSEQARKPNPLLDPNFPFRIEVWSIEAKPGEEIGPEIPRKRKEFVQQGGGAADKSADPGRSQLIVPARENEVFEIRVWNNSKQTAAITLLVDGINTLGQKRERLGQARSWVIPPTPPERPWVIEGWYLPQGDFSRPGQGGGYTLKRFQFTDVSKSVAARQDFTESLGVITAAFYAERGRALGVGEGPEEQRQMQTANFQPGRLLGAVNLRYVDERELNEGR